jgi:quercetin dioxygenase-like cupin family protein
MRKDLILKLLLSVFALVACVGVATAAGVKAGTCRTPDELSWSEVPDSGGVQVATLSGDFFKSAHRVMAKFPAGTAHPLHTHSAKVTVVVISGIFTFGAEGGPEKEYGPGSYLEVPGGFKHTSGCTAAGPCMVYQEGSGKFDMKPAAKK